MSFKTTKNYKGWVLVNTSQNYFCACKGNYRAPVGSIKRGDKEDLTKRFKAIVDQLESVGYGTED